MNSKTFEKSNIKIRGSRDDELDVIFCFLSDAAVWLRSKKIDYWQMWIDPQAVYENWIKEGFGKGQFRFVEYEGEIVGIFRLAWSDELFWGKQENDAGYIHSFTTSRKYAGFGLGYMILEKVEGLLRSEGKRYFRLDCGEKVPGLQSYYEKYGFSRISGNDGF